jgi:hypothetical protein
MTQFRKKKERKKREQEKQKPSQNIITQHIFSPLLSKNKQTNTNYCLV